MNSSVADNMVENGVAERDQHVERARSAYQDILAEIDGVSRRAKQDFNVDKIKEGLEKLQEVHHTTLSQ